ncbi:MAG: rRNA pseudouridine synthase [Planctomycetes bacterium]|nr:rRNA pseudouridine synthase [Planctomycetota bacterium]
MERLHKFLARCGVASRRQCEVLIAAGHVAVNGQKIIRMGVQVDPDSDDVRVDGRPIRAAPMVYYLLNKPKGYLVTQRDEFSRRRAADLLAGVQERVFPVGRLDQESEGLLLFTNDGGLAQRLAHPSYGVPKTYVARVRGLVDPSILSRLTQGIHLSEGRVAASSAAIRYSSYETSTIEITLHEGQNREIRRMLAQLGYPVKHLRRVRFGNLTDLGLPVGRFRPLRPREVQELRALALARNGVPPSISRSGNSPGLLTN